MPMSAHELKPKKVTSSVPTLHKGAMRSAQTEEVQEKPIPTFLMGSQELQEVCQRSKETLNQQENQESKVSPKEQESIEEEPPGETLVMDQNKSQDIRPYMLPKEIDSKGSMLPNPTSTIPGTKTFHHMDDPHKEIIRCLHTKRKQEVVISNLLIPDVPEDNTPPRRVPDQNKGVLLSFLLKGGPPGVPSKIKPIKNQGKALESQRRMKPDLLYLGAGYPVSR
ncbi:hypothetical protein F2Q69_00024599 [Brassica cretica]|uniref:Uncharacterized protein n=1 Tax=Brassica cretica TaxID=69181 RepID=A0A8S9PZS6_BRACR|nr:hypothetical protein F2Q69_00024599 [Brassica cretica]